MTNFIELSDYWAVEESEEGRFLTNRKTKLRGVNLGKDNEVKITHIDFKLQDEPYSYLRLFPTHKEEKFVHTFKVTNNHGTGLMQFDARVDKTDENDIPLYHSFINPGPLFEMLEFKDAITVPMEYEDVSIDYNSEDFRVYCPIARKNGKYDIFYKGSKLENASGAEAIDMRNFPTQILSQKGYKTYIISETDEVLFSFERKQFPELCFIQSPVLKFIEKTKYFMGSIKKGLAAISTDYIWMYNAVGNVGILYIGDGGKVEHYSIKDVPFSSKDSMYFLNEYYIIRHDDTENKNYLYFKGTFVGKTSNVIETTEAKVLIFTEIGFYLGPTFYRILPDDYGLTNRIANIIINPIQDKDGFDTEILFRLQGLLLGKNTRYADRFNNSYGFHYNSKTDTVKYIPYIEYNITFIEYNSKTEQEVNEEEIKNDAEANVSALPVQKESQNKNRGITLIAVVVIIIVLLVLVLEPF